MTTPVPATTTMNRSPYPMYATPHPAPGTAPAPGTGGPEAGDGRATKELELKKLPEIVYELWHRPIAHRYQTTPEYPRAGESVRIHVTVQPDGRLDGGYVLFTTDGTSPSPDARRAPLEAGPPLWDQNQFGFLSQWHADLPGTEHGTIVRYRIVVSNNGHDHVLDDAGPPLMVPRADRLGHIPPMHDFSYEVGAAQTPEWLRDAVVYHLMVSRFSAPAGQALVDEVDVPWMGFSGGTIAGLTERLDWLQELGVNCLLLSPLHHGLMHLGYDVIDYKRVTPELGDIDDVRRLVDAAHAQGMRILIDFEASYLGWHHPYFREARANADSPYRDWFLWEQWPDAPHGFMGGEILASLNHANPDARRYVIEGARFWVELGIDGFRLDSAHGSSLDFWTDFGAEMRAANADVVMIGEVVLPPPDVRPYHGRITTGVDFILNKALRRTFGNRTMTMMDFERNLSDVERYWSPTMVAPACYENHDQERLLYLAGDDKRRLKLATTCLLTLPATPILYYGSEVGLTHDAEGDMEFTSRRNMPWGDVDENLLAHVRRLIELRRHHVVFRRGQRRTVMVDEDSLGHALELPGCAPVCVVLNNAPTARELTVPIGDLWPDLTIARDLLGHENHQVADGAVTLTLDPFAGVILMNVDDLDESGSPQESTR